MTYDQAFIQGYVDGENGVKNEPNAAWDSPAAQGYASGWSNGNCHRQGLKLESIGDGHPVVQ